MFRRIRRKTAGGRSIHRKETGIENHLSVGAYLSSCRLIGILIQPAGEIQCPENSNPVNPSRDVEGHNFTSRRADAREFVIDYEGVQSANRHVR